MATRFLKINYCPICKEDIQDVRHGLALTIGYSFGGWGRRKTDVEISEEVCESCFNKLLPYMAILVDLVEGKSVSGGTDLTDRFRDLLAPELKDISESLTRLERTLQEYLTPPLK